MDITPPHLFISFPGFSFSFLRFLLASLPESFSLPLSPPIPLFLLIPLYLSLGPISLCHTPCP